MGVMDLSALNPAHLLAEPTGMDAGDAAPVDKVEHARDLLRKAADAVNGLWSMYARGWNVWTDEVTEANAAYSVAFRSIRAVRNPKTGNPMDAEMRIIEELKDKLTQLHVKAVPKHMLLPRNFALLPGIFAPREPEPEPEPMPPPPPPKSAPKYAYASWKKGAAARKAREEAERQSEKLAAELHSQNMRPKTRSGQGKS